MIDRAMALVLSGVVLLGVACVAFIGVCPPAATCARPIWLDANARMSAVVLIVLVAWLVRAALLVHVTERGVRHLATTVAPSHLRAAQVRVGARRLVCVEGDSEAAFCSGTWRPTIFIGEKLAGRLSAEELDAVLLHELDHATRYEPVRRAMRHAAADIFFFAPIVRWWARHRTVQVELAADRAAVDRVGARAVAAALWTLGGSAPSGVAAFMGSAGLRVAQLLGDSIAQPGPPRRLVAASVVGTYLALQVVACAATPFL